MRKIRIGGGPGFADDRIDPAAQLASEGSISDISVIAYDRDDFELLQEHVTADRPRAHLADIVFRPVERYELPQLGPLKFVLHDALEGRVTRTLNLDLHGKSLSSALLEMDLPERSRT